MAVQSASVTVATTATALNVAETGASDKVSVFVRIPSGSVTVYIGGSDVTTSNGVPFVASESVSIPDLANGEVVYACVAAATQAVSVLRTGVG
jgi:hypothetical protein